MSSVIRKKQGNGNLVLTLKTGDALLIDGDIAVKVKEVVTRNRVVLVINAPSDTKVRRKEFEEKRNKTQRENTGEA